MAKPHEMRATWWKVRGGSGVDGGLASSVLAGPFSWSILSIELVGVHHGDPMIRSARIGDEVCMTGSRWIGDDESMVGLLWIGDDESMVLETISP